MPTRTEEPRASARAAVRRSLTVAALIGIAAIIIDG